MKSGALGVSASPAEITNISRHGFWLLADDEEFSYPLSSSPGFATPVCPESFMLKDPIRRTSIGRPSIVT